MKMCGNRNKCYRKLKCQVTDSIDFPLFDIWEEVNCDKSTMILESYGRTVLLLSRHSTTGCISGSKSEPPFVAVNDWNGDLFGYFVPGKLISRTTFSTNIHYMSKQIPILIFIIFLCSFRLSITMHIFRTASLNFNFLLLQSHFT